MTDRFFITPQDVLILRGNKLFGDAGSFGQSLIPPWPSVAAGALRSALLVHDGIDLAAFASGKARHSTIGTRDEPGEFAVLGFYLAREIDGCIETLHAIPTDLEVVDRRKAHGERHQFEIRRLTPQAPVSGIEASAPLPQLAVLRSDAQAKPAKGLWLSQKGFADYLAGKVPAGDALVASDRLCKIDARVGVALDADHGRVRDGALFTNEAVAFQPGIGFLAEVHGAEELPETGILRLGGDGRAAGWRRVGQRTEAPDFNAIVARGRCRLALTSPGIFPDGWLPSGTEQHGDEFRFELHGVRGRLVCAAVPRAGVISGWDLARHRPKPAQRVAPAGSVFWLEDLEATPEQLRKLAIQGLWPATGDNAHRRAEGFNRFVFGQ